MRRFNKWSGRTMVIALVAVCLLGGVVYAAATAGSRTDPLVSLSYFESQITPDLLADAQDEAEDIRDDMTDDFDDKIDDYADEIAALVAQVESAGGESSSSATYTVVTLAAGETLALNVGDEVMLRIGTASVSGGSPALINTTTGETLGDGGSLVTNHLYLCTIDGRTLTAGSATTKVLLRQ